MQYKSPNALKVFAATLSFFVFGVGLILFVLYYFDKFKLSNDNQNITYLTNDYFATRLESNPEAKRVFMDLNKKVDSLHFELKKNICKTIVDVLEGFEGPSTYTQVEREAKLYNELRKKHKNKPTFLKPYTVSRLNMKHPNGCYFDTTMQVILSCNDFCQHLKESNFDSENQPISTLLKKYVTEIQKVFRTELVFDHTEYLDKFIEAFKIKHPDNKAGEQYDMCDYLNAIFQVLVEEESLTTPQSRFFEDHLNHKTTYQEETNSDGQTINKIHSQHSEYIILSCLKKDQERIDFILDTSINQNLSEFINQAESERLQLKQTYSKGLKYLFFYFNRTIEYFTPSSPKKMYGIVTHKIHFNNHTYIPKTIVCYLGNVSTGEKGGHYYCYTFDNENCYKLNSSFCNVVSTQVAFEDARKNAVMINYEKLDDIGELVP